MIPKPMLAASLDNIMQIKLPCFAQDKIDGIRCYMQGDVGYSRTGKPIRNRYIQSVLRAALLPDGLDGELVTFHPITNQLKSFNDIQSDVMSEASDPIFNYIVFDFNTATHLFQTYAMRYSARCNYLKMQSVRLWLKNVHELFITSYEGIELFEADALSRGQEGIILRSLNSIYKNGRSTINEQYLLKLKRFEDDEAIIMGYEELQHNCNEATADNFGLTERSSHTENLLAGNTLGSLICKSSKFEEFFKIGSGFTASQRDDIWSHKLELLGKTVTYKYQKHGMKNKPRIPIFKGFRKD